MGPVPWSAGNSSIRCYEAAIIDGAAIAAVPVKDTLKKGNDHWTKSSRPSTAPTCGRPRPPRRPDENSLKEPTGSMATPMSPTNRLSWKRQAIPVTLVEGAES